MATPRTRITKARKIQGLTLTQLAARLGVSENTVRRWEKGTVGIPDEQKLALSELFDAPVPYLMGWDNVVPLKKNGDEPQAA